MTICNAYLIKGYLLDKQAPPEIFHAVDALIASLSSSPPVPCETKQTIEPEVVGDATRDPIASYANRKNWHHPIPDDQVEEVRTMSETMTDQEIAAKFGTSRWTVIDYRTKHGLKKRKGKRRNSTASEDELKTPTGNTWSLEKRAAAAERMRALHSSGRMKKESLEPGEARAPL